MSEEPLHPEEQMPEAAVYSDMKNDLDIIMVATQLVDELGEDAVRLSKVKLVELIAANNLRAAAFWRDVMRLCEEHLAATGTPVSDPLPEAAQSTKIPAH
jgi:hypothetical protein